MQQHSRYLFLFAHPDDELYVGALLQRLIRAEKAVLLVYATSGDGAGFPERREAEALTSLALCGVSDDQVHFLKIPEHQVLNHLGELISRTAALAADFRADCFISHDYEGGHEAHDGLSFAASKVASSSPTAHFYTYPLYHGKPQERQGARFKPSRTEYMTLPLSPEEAALKTAIIAAHASQQAHFEGLKRSAWDYLDLLQAREVYFPVGEPIDFAKPPMPEVGYEFHRNGFRFADFQVAIHPHL
jgi:LmbE family N-acetylglucosaminyl deacetylase